MIDLASVSASSSGVEPAASIAARVPLATGSKGLDAADYIRQQREEWEQEMTRRILAPRE